MDPSLRTGEDADQVDAAVEGGRLDRLLERARAADLDNVVGAAGAQRQDGLVGCEFADFHQFAPRVVPLEAGRRLGGERRRDAVALGESLDVLADRDDVAGPSSRELWRGLLGVHRITDPR